MKNIKKETIKILLTFGITFSVTTLFYVGYINSISNGYERELEHSCSTIEDLERQYRQKSDKLDKYMQENEYLEEQIFNMVNGYSYDVEGECDGISYSYQYTRVNKEIADINN